MPATHAETSQTTADGINDAVPGKMIDLTSDDAIKEWRDIGKIALIVVVGVGLAVGFGWLKDRPSGGAILEPSTYANVVYSTIDHGVGTGHGSSLVDILAFTALIGLIPAAIAGHKGYSFLLWWFFGASVFVVALPVALLMRPMKTGNNDDAHDARTKTCPFCAENIKVEAIVCKHCGRDLNLPEREPLQTSDKPGFDDVSVKLGCGSSLATTPDGFIRQTRARL